MRTLLALILCLFAMRSLAQPASLTRVLRTIDFEERRLGNDEDLPMHWVKVDAPGFPHYVNGRFTTDRAHSGAHSFRMDLNGGSVLYRYEANQIKVRQGACYRIDAFTQTTPLQHARARLSAYFTDLDGHPLPNTLKRSDPYVSTTPAEGDEAWHKLSIELAAAMPDAAYLVLEVGLLQPQVYSESTLGQRALHGQDIRGSAWFDDITVSQVPRVRIGTRQPGNIFRRSDPLNLMVELDDAFTEDLSIQLTVGDATGRAVYQRSGTADSPATASPTTQAATRESARPAAARVVSAEPVVGRRYDLALPDLPPGFYTCVITTSSQGQQLASRSLSLIRLPNDTVPSSPDPRFGVIATDLPLRAWGPLADLLPHLGAGRVKLGVWTRTADAEQFSPSDFDAALVKLQERHITTTACLLDLPPSLTRRLDEIQSPAVIASGSAPGTSWLRLLKANDDDWQPTLEYLLSRHANHLDRWQLGADGSDAFVTRKGMREVYNRLYAKFAQLTSNPDLAMPWPAWYELEGNLPATVALSIPASVLPSQLPLYIQDLRGIQGHHGSLTYQRLARERTGRDEQIRDLAQRVIYALAAGTERLDLPFPFTTRPDDEAPAGAGLTQPTELFLIMRSLATTLGNTRYAGKVPIADGVEAFLFDNHGQGTLALWDTGREGERNAGAGSLKPLPINLGPSPRMFDLWGNEIPLIRPADDAVTATVQLVIGPTPVFLTNIDGPLAQLRASVAIDRPLIESTFQSHTRKLHFKNTYPAAITGSLKLKPPPGWSITPSTHNFSLNPGESFDRDLAIEFPYNSPAGSRTMQAEFTLQSDRASTFHMPLTLKLGLSDVGMQTLAVRDGADLIIQQIVQNYSDKPVDYSAFAIFPGKSRQERLVTNLLPGRSVIKKFRFENIPAELPANTRARIGLKEIDGPRILNDEIEVR